MRKRKALNRELATSLNRDMDLKSKSMPADFEAELTGGYRWFFGEDWELGFLAIGSYSNKWRNRERTLQEVTNPSQSYTESLRTINQVSLTAGLNVGLRFHRGPRDQVAEHVPAQHRGRSLRICEL